MLIQCESALSILNGLNSATTHIHYNFLGYILPIVNNLNVEFQSEGVRIHTFQEKITTEFRVILDNFIRATVLKSRNPFEVDVADITNYRKIEEMYVGGKTEILIRKLEQDPEKQFDGVIAAFRVKAQAFYVELSKQIQKRIDHKDPLLVNLACVDPVKAVSGTIPSIAFVYSKFYDVLKLNVDQVDYEWRRLSSHENVLEKFKEHFKRLPKKKKLKTKTHVRETIPLELNLFAEDITETEDEIEVCSEQFVVGEEIDPAAFWSYLATLKNANGKQTYGNICRLMKAIMSLPHSSAGAERKFSLLKLIKTPLRNKLAPDTISCLMQVHRYIPNIDTWDVPESLVKNVGDWKSILKEK